MAKCSAKEKEVKTKLASKSFYKPLTGITKISKGYYLKKGEVFGPNSIEYIVK